jgi:peptide methionine sulfoxide reductase MsrB
MDPSFTWNRLIVSPSRSKSTPDFQHPAVETIHPAKSLTEYQHEESTGWPSFYDPIPGAIGTTIDQSAFMTRVAVHCHRCGGHLGHVFDDGQYYPDGEARVVTVVRSTSGMFTHYDQALSP